MWGLASRARSAAAYRAHTGEAEQPAEWEAEAIALEMDVYAALYGGGRPLAELAARAAWVSAAHERPLSTTLHRLHARLSSRDNQ